MSAAASRTIRAFTPVFAGLWLDDAAEKLRSDLSPPGPLRGEVKRGWVRLNGNMLQVVPPKPALPDEASIGLARRVRPLAGPMAGSGETRWALLMSKSGNSRFRLALGNSCPNRNQLAVSGWRQ
jgi:hypothetical protein